MGKQKKIWSAEQKLSTVLTVLKEQGSVAELSRQHGVAESLIHKWKSPILGTRQERLQARQRRHT